MQIHGIRSSTNLPSSMGDPPMPDLLAVLEKGEGGRGESDTQCAAIAKCRFDLRSKMAMAMSRYSRRVEVAAHTPIPPALLSPPACLCISTPSILLR